MKLKHLALVTASLLVLSSCGGGSGGNKGLPSDALPTTVTSSDPTANASAIVYNDMAVHDPSIIKADNGTYYVFGSHLSVAKSTDLMSWTRVADGVNDQNPIFSTYASQAAEGIEWVGGHQGSWAADVIKLKDGKYYFYYNHCATPDNANGDCVSPRSYIGVATSSNIEGPYVNKGLILRTGMTDQEIAQGKGPDGVTSYDGATMPNGIDPHVFYDKNGKLWMVYGSYFGGIFILELDESTGAPKAGQGYGKHLAGGGFAPIEGTWITYSPETDYYYMFNSIGGFAANGGYNIRVSRSKTPDGPYLDSAGKDMVAANTNVDTLSKYGVKLMGGFNFVSEVGDAGDSWGYLSPGHNSVYYDATAKKYFLVTHARFPNRGEEHSVRVHELWLNKDGWFVASPQRYAPITGANVVDAGDVAGDYRLIGHQHDTNTTGHNSVYVKLNENRTISGEMTGYYSLSSTDKNRINVVITNAAEAANIGAYEGVMQWQWDESLRQLVPVFSAVSTTGSTLWGSKLPNKTTAESLNAIADDLGLPAETIKPTLAVPQRGTRAATISWASSNPAIINLKHDKKTGALTGIAHVNRPGASVGDQSVTLTATITLDGQTKTKAIVVKVLAKGVTPTAQYKFDGNLQDSVGNFAAGTPTGDRINNTGGVATYAAGKDGQAIALNNYGVLLPNNVIANNEYTISYWLSPAAKTWFTSSFFAAVGFDWISLPVETSWDQTFKVWHISNTVGKGDTWCASGVALPLNQWTQVMLSVKNGSGTLYVNGQEKCTAGGIVDLFSNHEGTFALGVNYWDIPYNGLVDDLKIYNTGLSANEATIDPSSKAAAEILALAKAELDIGNLSALKEDIDLPVAGSFGSSITWSSNNIAAIDSVGTITQPAATEPDANATLTATITYGGLTATKEFAAVVKSKAPPPPVATYKFDENLADQTGTFASGIVKGGLLNVDGGQVSYAGGIANKALVLDGNSCVKLGDNMIQDYSYSISIWLNQAEAKNYTSAFFGMTDANHWISLIPGQLNGGANSLLWSGSISWYDGVFVKNGSAYKLPLNQWVNVIVTVDNGKYRAYIDGVQVADMTGFPNVLSGATQFSVGCTFWDTAFHGMVDELNVYNDVLTAEDVSYLYGKATAK